MVIIAQDLKNAAKIMKTKVLYPYQNLHPDIKERVKLVSSNNSKMEFSNGSSIEVVVSGRSGTCNILHISELGFTSRHRPEVAKEIITGSIPSVHEGGYIFVESTAEGASGAFYEICTTATNQQNEGRPLVWSDFKMHFFAWWQKDMNCLRDEDADLVVMFERHLKYFKELEENDGIKLTKGQKAWYVSQEATLQDLMQQEHPSTPAEAFANSGAGKIFRMQMFDARKGGRIGAFPNISGRLTHTFWDIGMSKNNQTAVWFIQNYGGMWVAVDYMEAEDKSMESWVNTVREHARDKGYLLGKWVGPHDLKKRGGFQGKTLHKEIQNAGVEFEVVPKVASKDVSIATTRTNFSLLHIDQANCEEAIEHLDAYRYEWDQPRGMYTNTPYHGKESNCADALQQWALWIDKAIIEAARESSARPDKSKNRSTTNPVDGQPRPRKRSRMRGHY